MQQTLVIKHNNLRFNSYTGLKEVELNFRELCKKEIPNTTYLTHGIHSYPAKFIPQIPNYFIRKFTEEDDIVLDNFSGSGTTLVEAKLLGRNSYGVDINPLAHLVTRVKTTPINPIKLKDAIFKIENKLEHFKGRAWEVDFPNKRHWFDEQAEKELGKIKAVIDLMKPEVDPEIYDFFLVCFSSTIRPASNADPHISKPFISKHMREKIRMGRTIEPIKYFKKCLYKYAERVNDFTLRICPFAERDCEDKYFAKMIGYDARDFKVPDGEKNVQLVVTSPPYVNAQEYFRSIKLELFWLNLSNNGHLNELKKGLVGTENVSSKQYQQLWKFGIDKLDDIIEKIYEVDKKRAYIVYQYFKDMERAIKNCYKVLEKRGHFCIVVGDNVIRKIPLPVHEFIIDISRDSRFEPELVGYDLIKSRSLMTKRHETAGLIEGEWVLLFRK